MNTNVLSLLGASELKVPFNFDTDVNAPAFAEYITRDNKDDSSCAYITVGTGIGVGIVVNGNTVHGCMHPEAGHIMVQRKESDLFPGVCPYHKCCIEGMCSSTALASRKGLNISDLPLLSDDDEIWNICAYYLAQLCATLVLVVSPERIVFGGGIMNRECLLPKIRVFIFNFRLVDHSYLPLNVCQTFTRSMLNGYIQQPSIQTDDINRFIARSAW